MNVHHRLILALILPLLAFATPAVAASHAVIKVGLFPGDVATGFGAVWVNDHRGDRLYRISPSNKVTKVDIDESVCNFPAIGGGRVWVWGCDSNSTIEVDPKKMKIVAEREGGLPVYGAGSLWTMDQQGDILRIDPKSGVKLATIDPRVDDANGGSDGIWDGSLWVSGDSSVSRIDVRTSKVSAVIPLPGAKPSGTQEDGYLYANFGMRADGKIWLDNVAGMYVVDPKTNAVHKIGLKFSPLSQSGDVPIVAGEGSVWVRTGDETVVRIDPGSEKVIATYPASGGGGGLAVAFHSLWVVNAQSGTVWRTPVQFRKPATGGAAAKPTAAVTPPTTINVPARQPVRTPRPAPSTSASSNGATIGLVVGVVVLLAIGGAVFTIRRRHAAIR